VRRPRDVSNFVIKNIEGTGYGGGPTTCTGSGIREKLGHFSIGGDGSSGGFVADGIYFHDNGYSNLCANEHYVAVFGDDENGHQITRASFFSLSTSSVTEPTLTPPWRFAGSSTLSVTRRGATSTASASGVSCSIGFFFAFMMLGSEA